MSVASLDDLSTTPQALTKPQMVDAVLVAYGKLIHDRINHKLTLKNMSEDEYDHYKYDLAPSTKEIIHQFTDNCTDFGLKKKSRSPMMWHIALYNIIPGYPQPKKWGTAENSAVPLDEYAKELYRLSKKTGMPVENFTRVEYEKRCRKSVPRWELVSKSLLAGRVNWPDIREKAVEYLRENT